MEQKVVISNDASDVNRWLADGWSIVSITAGYVAADAQGSQFKYCYHGQFCFVLERKITE